MGMLTTKRSLAIIVALVVTIAMALSDVALAAETSVAGSSQSGNVVSTAQSKALLKVAKGKTAKKALKSGKAVKSKKASNKPKAKNRKRVVKSTNRSKQRKFVMIGDSYAMKNTGLGIFGWPEAVAAYLGIGSKNCQVLRRPGAGFAASPRSFYRMVRARSVDRSVTDVLIVGGVGNDIKKTKAAITSGYARTMRVLHAKYPNALIMHANACWHVGDDSFNAKVVQRTPFYKRLAKKNKVKYLAGVEGVLKGHEGWMRDSRHPNWMGTLAISTKLCEKIPK